MTQYQRVLAVLEASTIPMALFEIKQAILARFEQVDSEAGISARIRDIRHDLESQNTGTIAAHRVPDKAWYRYRVQRLQQPSNTSGGHFCA